LWSSIVPVSTIEVQAAESSTNRNHCHVNFLRCEFPFVTVSGCSFIAPHFLCTRMKSFSLEIRRPRPLDINQSISTISRKSGWLDTYPGWGSCILEHTDRSDFVLFSVDLQPPVTSTDECVCVSSLIIKSANKRSEDSLLKVFLFSEWSVRLYVFLVVLFLFCSHCVPKRTVPFICHSSSKRPVP
jgi:hypothetical protein